MSSEQVHRFEWSNWMSATWMWDSMGMFYSGVAKRNDLHIDSVSPWLCITWTGTCEMGLRGLRCIWASTGKALTKVMSYFLIRSVPDYVQLVSSPEMALAKKSTLYIFFQYLCPLAFYDVFRIFETTHNASLSWEIESSTNSPYLIIGDGIKRLKI